MMIRNFTDIKSLLLDNRSIKQIVFKNTFWLVMAEVIQGGIVFVITIWLARHFGPAIYGKFAFALSFIMLFSVLADFGFGTLTVREIARDKSKTAQYIDNIIAMKFVLGLITLGLIVLVIQFLGKEPEVVKLVYFLGIYIIINTFATFFQAIFRANEKMQYEAACRGIESLSLLGLVAFFILNKGSILTIGYAYIGAALIGAIISSGAIWHYFLKFFLKIDFKICKEILKEAWPFGLSFIFISAYYYIDTVMLSVMKTDQIVGWYNSAYRILMILSIAPSILFNAVFPRMSLLFISAKETLKLIYQQFLKYIFIISFPTCVGMTLLAEKFILLIYGSDFIPATIALQILIWSFLFTFFGGLFGNLLNACNKQTALMIITGLATVINILLNLFLIPQFNYIGASIVANLTKFFVIAVAFYILLKIGFAPQKEFYFKTGPKVIFAAICMGIFIAIFKEMNLFFLVLFSVVIYFGILFLLKELRKEEFFSLKKILINNSSFGRNKL